MAGAEGSWPLSIQQMILPKIENPIQRPNVPPTAPMTPMIS